MQEKPTTCQTFHAILEKDEKGGNRAVYTRGNKRGLTLAAAYIIHERNYLYEYKLPGQDKPQLEKAVNVEFVQFIRGVRVLCKPRLFSRNVTNVFMV